MRRARIQIKPNVAKAAKQAVPVKLESIPASAEPEEVHSNEVEQPVESSEDPVEPVTTKPTEPSNHHVHFGDEVIDNEQQRISNLNLGVQQQNPTNQSVDEAPVFAVPLPPARIMFPRSRNVSMCEDETILQPKQPREKRRFTGKEELDTKTWKMSDLTRWNPKNEHASFKRERRSSTSSSVVTKSEYGDFGEPPRVNAPQVKIGLDGKLVIDEASLLVQSAQINHESVWETVEEGRMGSKITSMSFRNRIFRKPNIWSEKETDLFYEVLQCTGQDFGLMHHYLPQRSRPELKSKYNREEKLNWPRLLKAISHPVRLDGALEGRIARYMAEMEEEEREKKERHEYEKAEEKRVRVEIRQRQQQERDEEKNKRIQAKDLVRQARELEKGARIAARTSEKEAAKEAKAREKVDTKQMAAEAKRIAAEARQLIKEARMRQRMEKEQRKHEMEQDSLEREAERIIRRLIQDSQREERRQMQVAQKEERRKMHDAQREERRLAKLAKGKEYREKKKAALALSALSKGPEELDTVDPNASGPELGDTTSDSSTTATSSDEEAFKKSIEKREKARMREERRNLEPRKTVVEKKPVYTEQKDLKYALQAGAIDFAKAAHGNMFHSADEQDELDAAGPAPPPAAPSPPSPVEQAPPAPIVIPVVVLDDEPVPQAVHDVIDDIIRARSKTPAPENPEVIDLEEETPAEEVAEVVEMAEVEPAADPVEEAAPVVEEEEEEMVIDVVNVEETDEPASKRMRADASKQLEKVAEVVEPKEPEVVVEEPADAPLEEPSTSSAAATSSAEPPSESLKRPIVRRTIKKPVNYAKKKKT